MLPAKADVTFYYVCPKCGDGYWVSSNEARTPGFKVVCHCANVLKIQTLENIKVSYKQKKVKPKLSVPKHVEEAYTTLVGFGYKEPHLKVKLMSYGCDNVQDLVKEYLKEK